MPYRRTQFSTRSTNHISSACPVQPTCSQPTCGQHRNFGLVRFGANFLSFVAVNCVNRKRSSLKMHTVLVLVESGWFISS